MPEGPLITSPDSLFEALDRELIKKTPEKFKIKVIKQLWGLFSFQNYNPIYAGFGNKSTDALAYVTCGIPVSRIYTINTSSIIYKIDDNHKTTYEIMSRNIEHYFSDFNKDVFYDPQM